MKSLFRLQLQSRSRGFNRAVNLLQVSIAGVVTSKRHGWHTSGMNSVAPVIFKQAYLDPTFYTYLVM